MTNYLITCDIILSKSKNETMLEGKLFRGMHADLWYIAMVIKYSWNLQQVNKFEQQLTHNCIMFLKVGLGLEFKQFDTLIYLAHCYLECMLAAYYVTDLVTDYFFARVYSIFNYFLVNNLSCIIEKTL